MEAKGFSITGNSIGAKLSKVVDEAREMRKISPEDSFPSDEQENDLPNPSIRADRKPIGMQRYNNFITKLFISLFLFSH
jgi:hypothetical protein